MSELDNNFDLFLSDAIISDHTASLPQDKKFRTRTWIGTYHNPDQEILLESFLRSFIENQAQYVVGQREVCPKTGTPHIQFAVYYPNPQQFTRFQYLQRQYHHFHIEGARNQSKALNYTQKEKTRDLMSEDSGPIEIGKKPVSYKGKNKRDQLNTVKHLLTFNQEQEEELRLQDYIMLKKVKAIKQEQDSQIKEPDLKFKFKFHNWQDQILDIINNPPDDRSIYWIVDLQGGKGKTIFAKWLYSSQENSIYLGLEKRENILYSIKKDHKLIIFDLARGDLPDVNYSVLEKIKDGIWYNGKYTTKTELRKENAHLIVFANQYPNTTQLSQDRWKIFTITADEEDKNQYQLKETLVQDADELHNEQMKNLHVEAQLLKQKTKMEIKKKLEHFEN